MIAAADNLAYLGRGTRTYGLRPVLGRARGYWELQWVFRGGARPDLLNTGVKIGNPPCLYLSHPDSPHGWTDDGANSAEVFVLHFRVVPAALAVLVKPAKTLTLELDKSTRRQMWAHLEAVGEMTRTGDGRLALKLTQLLVEVALLALESAAPVTAKSRPANRVEHALHWFEENIGENPSADEVARAVGVSGAHLRRLFAEAGRAAPRVELARLRMAAAQRCLRQGWKLERIAQYLGFSEASVLSRAFAAVCGVSPRKWRAREKL
jgi:AraC-like DNA-binding protein